MGSSSPTDTERLRATARQQRDEARRQRQLAHQMSAWAAEMLASARSRQDRSPAAGERPVSRTVASDESQQ